MKRSKKVAIAVVATANLSGAQPRQHRRLRRLQTASTDANSYINETALPQLDVLSEETQSKQESSLSYNLVGIGDETSSEPMTLQHLDEQNMNDASVSNQEHMQAHISASGDAKEGDHDTMMVGDEVENTISESQSEAHHDSQGGMRDSQSYTKSGKVAKSTKSSNKSPDHWNAGDHTGKPTHAPTQHSSSSTWWHGEHSGKGKSSKSTAKTAAPNNWNWSNPNGKASKLFKPKSSGWWPPHPHPSKMPSTKMPTTQTYPPSTYPPLVWEGVNGCTLDSPCNVCTGDCDSNEGCMPGLECFKRSGSEPVPGCTSGGLGDVPGADYCYDPSAVVPVSPTISPVSPTLSPVQDSLPFLQWKGVNGCTPTSPCDICQGDCDENEDCLNGFECFKRSDGEYTQVPGCAVGGSGDIAGADYCYDPNSVGPPPSASPTKVPTEEVPTVPPATDPPVSESPTRTLEAFFMQTQARSSTDAVVSRTRTSIGARSLQLGSSQHGWCAGGALAPDYYQLLLEECRPNVSTAATSAPIGKVEQMDQLWSMDSEGYIRSIFNTERCMLVSSAAVQFETPIEIGPCSDDSALNLFYYETSTFPYTLKLQGEAYASMCVTFLGDEPSTGAEMVLAPCENEDKFGWDFIPEASLGKPTMKPTSSLPKLRYLGRDACTVDSPCGACVGDCDTSEGCDEGLQCFQRDRGESTQVPGCAVGGAGDIPGADYCYDANGPNPPTPSPPLKWRGSRGCSVEEPCPICTGDCNTDGDCQKSLSCFKRELGDETPVPGCAVGGLGDIPGGDYCYDPSQRTNIGAESSTQSSTEEVTSTAIPQGDLPPTNQNSEASLTSQTANNDSNGPQPSNKPYTSGESSTSSGGTDTATSNLKPIPGAKSSKASPEQQQASTTQSHIHQPHSRFDGEHRIRNEEKHSMS